MRSAQQMIVKHRYAHPQLEHFISVENSLFFYENGKKYLLIQFSNNTDYPVDFMEFSVTQLDHAGVVLGKTTLACPNLQFEAGTTYASENGIPVSDACTDFLLTFSKVTSGDYTYRVQGNCVQVLFTPRLPSAPVAGLSPTGQHIQDLRAPRRKTTGALCVLILVALMLLSFYQIFRYYQRQGVFAPAHNSTTIVSRPPLCNDENHMTFSP